MIVDMFPILKEPNIITIVVRTLLAVLCAGIIGYDRGVKGASAGLRTHIIVCLGAMMAMSTGQYASIMYGADATRIGAQVVSGIGFLGAGSIMVDKNRDRITGLTTAAGLWGAACIGLAIGISFYEGAIMGTFAVYCTERFLRKISKKTSKRG